MGRHIAELRQRRILKSFAQPYQSRQTQAVEILGKAVDRHRELDELFESASGDVAFPACTQNVQAVFDRVGGRRCHGVTGRDDVAIISDRRLVGNARLAFMTNLPKNNTALQRTSPAANASNDARKDSIRNEAGMIKRTCGKNRSCVPTTGD